MTIPFRAITGLAHVESMSASIAFYEKIDFRVAATFAHVRSEEKSSMV